MFQTPVPFIYISNSSYFVFIPLYIFTLIYSCSFSSSYIYTHSLKSLTFIYQLHFFIHISTHWSYSFISIHFIIFFVCYLQTDSSYSFVCEKFCYTFHYPLTKGVQVLKLSVLTCSCTHPSFWMLLKVMQWNSWICKVKTLSASFHFHCHYDI